jgi:hypothetical protein
LYIVCCVLCVCVDVGISNGRLKREHKLHIRVGHK